MSTTTTGYRNSANNFQAVELPLESLTQTFGNNGTNITTITVVYNTVTFVQTITYSGSFVQSITPFLEP